MTREQLLRGIQWLCNKLYESSAFGERILRFIDKLGKRLDPRYAEGTSVFTGFHTAESDSLGLLSKLVQLGPGEAEMWSRVRKGLSKKPESAEFVIPMLVQYAQIRYMYQQGRFWDSHLPSGPAEVSSSS